jgi:hypothetical protein
MESAGFNFINVLQATFAHTDPQSAKKTDILTVFFVLWGSASVKAACRTLTKMTPSYPYFYFCPNLKVIVRQLERRLKMFKMFIFQNWHIRCLLYLLSS